jgi:hypothetical protein
MSALERFWSRPEAMHSSFARLCARLVRHPEWNIGVLRRPAHALLEGGDLSGVEWLPHPPASGFRADPFPLARADGLYVFYEEFPWRAWRGRISCMRLGEGLTAELGRVVFEGPQHMSYPYLFEHGGACFCAPECHRARNVVLYRTERFPGDWRPAAILLDGVPAVDSTLFQHEGRWWLACGIADQHGQAHRRLYLWHATDLLGPWEPHARNPVKDDPRSARPAGTPFAHGDALYRPAQDCSEVYGGGITVNRVVRLTPSAFQEEEAAHLAPDRRGAYSAGLHTLSCASDLTVVDGLRYRFNPRVLRATVGRGLRAAGRRAQVGG